MGLKKLSAYITAHFRILLGFYSTSKMGEKGAIRIILMHYMAILKANSLNRQMLHYVFMIDVILAGQNHPYPLQKAWHNPEKKNKKNVKLLYWLVDMTFIK